MYSKLVPTTRVQDDGKPPLREETVFSQQIGMSKSAIALNESWPARYAIFHLPKLGTVELRK